MITNKISTNVLSSKYSINGMTCESCVKTITVTILKIPDVISVQVSLKDKAAHITSNRKIELNEVRRALSENTKYSVSEYQSAITVDTAPTNKAKQSILTTYKPLIMVFAFIFLVSFAYQISLGNFNSHIFMNHIMAGFFIGLSFFKFLDLNAFSESFSSYDPLAQKWLVYGKTYPFIELLLGLLFTSGKALVFANAITTILLSLTTYGVYIRLQSKTKFQCACLGTAFSLPLSKVTIVENLAMILMALINLIILATV